MKGRRKEFEIAGKKLTLARLGLDEAYELEPIIVAIIGDPEVSVVTTEIKDLLERAVADESDADKEALEYILQDAADTLELWDAFVAFGDLIPLYMKRNMRRLELIKSMRVEQLRLAGLSEQEANDLFRTNLKSMHGDVNALAQDTALPQSNTSN